MQENLETAKTGCAEKAASGTPSAAELDKQQTVAEIAAAPPEPSREAHAQIPAQEGAARQAKKKGITFKGICINCGERFELSEEEMAGRSFGFCNAECRMKFDMELAENPD